MASAPAAATAGPGSPEAVTWRAVAAAGITAAVWITVNAARMWRQPAFLDEVDFLEAGVRWPAHATAVPHPPGFVDVLRVLFGAFGATIGVARIPGLLSAFATLALLPSLAAALTRDRTRAPRAALAAVLVFGFMPLATQNVLLVDIDNTLMTPVLVGVFLVAHHGASWPRAGAAAALALAVAAALWLKLPPPPMLVAALVLAAAFAGAWRRAIEIAAASLAGAGVAAATLALAPHAGALILWSLTANSHRLGGYGGLRTILVRAPQTLGVFVLWLGLPFAGLAAWALVRPPATGSASRTAWIAAALFVFVTIGFYALFVPPAYGYPKCQAVALPFMAAMVGALAARSDRFPRTRVTGLAAAGAFAVQFALGDTLWRVYRVSFTTGLGQIGQRLAATRSELGLATLPLFAALAIVTALTWRDRRRSSVMVGACLAASVGAGAALLATQSGAPYSTRYAYTAEPAALLNAAACVRAGTPVGTQVLAPKDVLYHAEREGRLSSDLVSEDASPDSLLAALRAHRYGALVWTSKDEARATSVLGDPRVRAALDAGFDRHAFGDWIVLVSRPAAASPA